MAPGWEVTPHHLMDKNLILWVHISNNCDKPDPCTLNQSLSNSPVNERDSDHWFNLLNPETIGSGTSLARSLKFFSMWQLV